MPSFAKALAQACPRANFRAYTSTDIVGVEVGGAVKNVLAVGAGLSDGLGFGANTRVALITRGLVEMMRLGVALGAQRETFMGLAGLGDLVLTCTDDQSRNRRFGLLLAAGRSPSRRWRRSARSSRATAQRRRLTSSRARRAVEMPLCEGVYRVLYEQTPAEGSGARADEPSDQAGDGLRSPASINSRPQPNAWPARFPLQGERERHGIDDGQLAAEVHRAEGHSTVRALEDELGTAIVLLMLAVTLRAERFRVQLESMSRRPVLQPFAAGSRTRVWKVGLSSPRHSPNCRSRAARAAASSLASRRPDAASGHRGSPSRSGWPVRETAAGCPRRAAAHSREC